MGRLCTMPMPCESADANSNSNALYKLYMHDYIINIEEDTPIPHTVFI